MSEFWDEDKVQLARMVAEIEEFTNILLGVMSERKVSVAVAFPSFQLAARLVRRTAGLTEKDTVAVERFVERLDARARTDMHLRKRRAGE